VVDERLPRGQCGGGAAAACLWLGLVATFDWRFILTELHNLRSAPAGFSAAADSRLRSRWPKTTQCDRSSATRGDRSSAIFL